MADEVDPVNQLSPHDDPSTRIWSSYISGAEKHNRNLARSWKGDMDALLIFAGLFSASVTAFIVESYKTLSPAPEDTTNALLAQISQQLAAMSNASAAINSIAFSQGNFDSAVFVPPTSSLVCNTLWFLSLGFSLTCALSATLVEQWVRNYLQATESRPTPHERARICAYLYQGLEKFKMAAVVEAIPMLLHASLLLFFAGLVEFLRPVNAAISYLTLGILITCVMLYALATVIPAFRRDCPYQTPLSGLWWKIMKILRILRRHDPDGPPILVSGTIAQAREAEAINISFERDQRDFAAMSWTLKNLRHESEFEAFVEVIPRAVAGFDYSAKLLLHRLLYHNNLSVRLGHRVPRLLISCTGGVLDPVVGQKRAATCLAAIWSLSMITMHTDSSETESSSPILSRATLRFDEFTLRDIQTVKQELPGISDHAISAATVVAQGLIDMYVEQVFNQELLLADFVLAKGSKSLAPPAGKPVTPLQTPRRAMQRVRRILEKLQGHLDSGEAIASPITFVLFTTVYSAITDAIRLITSPPTNVNPLDIASRVLESLRQFRERINQTNFSLTLDYAAYFLTSRSLPYEAFNTFRRIFLKIEFDLLVSVQSQIRFVSYLDEALESDSEGGTRFPQSIINIILGLTRAVRDPTCALKTRAIITRYMRFFPSQDEARKALSFLDGALPKPSPTLDLFTLHMYSNLKLDKGMAQPSVRNPAVVADIANLAFRNYETA
ncbi:hypothetical protein D9615_001160 [Tricholomella constricta]|uniref:DUF6535 domain-containing protein n=1 Tax=Tricholomella constricta TaxID=117010 RepID=A0A8H5HKF1_9AGAR|nr:hypothetical protein D9615_001160 [Tricholomella constricta]